MKKILVFFCILSFFPVIVAQRVTSQSASEALSRGNYEISYEQYVVLLKSFPRDPFYLYGAGVSLVLLPARPAEATEYLRASLSNSSAVKSAPPDTRFYLARALHLSGHFSEAVAEYDKYSSQAGKKESKELGIAMLIKQCNEGVGKLAEEVTEVSQVTQVAAVSTNLAVNKAETPVPEIRKPDPVPQSTDSYLTLALDKRHEADSLESVAVEHEAILRSADSSVRDSIKNDVADIRARSSVLLRESDSLLILAGVPVTKSKTVPDIDVSTSPESKTVVERASITDSSAVIEDTVVEVSAQVKQAPIVTLFAIRESPYYSGSNPVTVSSSFPEGLFYTTQLAVFRNPVDPAYFKRLYPVFGIRNPGSELTYYYAGLFRNYADASKALPGVRNEGFKDAFIAIMMDGKPVSAERGSILAKEWGTKGFPQWKGVVPSESNLATGKDTVIQTLLLRIEVLRSSKDDNAQLNDELSRLAGDNGFEIMNPEAGLYVYLVGKFVTFESASAYADLLRRNGYKDARVVAYAGSREIPLETALKYFEK